MDVSGKRGHGADSPIARQDIRLDIADLYVFGGETGTAFVIKGVDAVSPDAPGPIGAQGTTGEAVITAAGYASGPVKQATHFGLSPMCCMQSDMRFKTVSPWIYPDGIRNLFAGHTVYSIVLEVPDGELVSGANGKRLRGMMALG